MLLKYKTGVVELIEMVRKDFDIFDVDWPYHGIYRDNDRFEEAFRHVRIWLGTLHAWSRSTSGIVNLPDDVVHLSVFNATVPDFLNQPYALVGQVPVTMRPRTPNSFYALKDKDKIVHEVAEMIEKYERS